MQKNEIEDLTEQEILDSLELLVELGLVDVLPGKTPEENRYKINILGESVLESSKSTKQ